MFVSMYQLQLIPIFSLTLVPFYKLQKKKKNFMNSLLRRKLYSYVHKLYSVVDDFMLDILHDRDIPQPRH